MSISKDLFTLCQFHKEICRSILKTACQISIRSIIHELGQRHWTGLLSSIEHGEVRPLTDVASGASHWSPSSFQRELVIIQHRRHSGWLGPWSDGAASQPRRAGLQQPHPVGSQGQALGVAILLLKYFNVIFSHLMVCQLLF